jgi:hypothetical protein
VDCFQKKWQYIQCREEFRAERVSATEVSIIHYGNCGPLRLCVYASLKMPFKMQLVVVM